MKSAIHSELFVSTAVFCVGLNNYEMNSEFARSFYKLLFKKYTGPFLLISNISLLILYFYFLFNTAYFYSDFNSEVGDIR